MIEVSDIATSFLAAAGGSGLVVAGLSGWLGKVWASRIEAATKATYEKEVKYLESSLELTRAQQIRNSDARFELYSEVWTHLMDLRSAGDRLWEIASQSNLEQFVDMLDKANIAVNRGRLILKEDHYKQLQAAFQSFEQYEIGKRQLLNLRFPGAIEELYTDFPEQDIRDQIQANAGNKSNYEKLSEEILKEFREQLGLSG